MKYDIFLANVVFEDNTNQSKVRPIVELANGNNLIIGAKITSHAPRADFKDEYQIVDYYGTGLTTKSTIRLSKIINIPNTSIIKKLGKLSKTDIQNLNKLGY